MEMLYLHKATLVLAGFIIALAALSDAKAFRIPNLASLALLLLFPAFVLTAPEPVLWEKHLLVFAVVFTFGYALYAKKFAGAGDIKLIAALSLWAGPSFVGLLLLATAMAGGVLSIGIGLLAIVRHRLSRTKEPLKLTKTPIPYGVAIAVGGLCVFALLSHPVLPVGP